MTQLTKQTAFIDKDYIEVNLDLHDKSSTSQVEQCYTLMQNNHNSRVLRCILTKGCGLLPVDLSNSALTLYIKKADLALVMLSGQIVDAKNGIVDFLLTRQALAIADKITCEVIKTGVDKSTMSFPNFILEIDSTIIDEDLVESTNDFSALNDALSKVNNWESRFTELENKVDPFATTLIISQQMAELGSSQNVTLNWSYNRDIKSQKINDENLDNTIRSKSYGNVTTGTTYTLTAISVLDFTTSKSVSITFANGVYYGKSSSTDYNSNLIKSLNKELSTNKSRTITVDASANEYIYYCVPTRLGECSFNVNGFDGGFDKVATISFANDFGYKEDYYIYKSTNSNLGSTTVIVK